MKRALLGWVLIVCAGCGDDDGGSVDLGVDGGDRCQVDLDCDDGLFCNGVERCFPGGSMQDERGCVPGDDPCGATDTCDETAGMCVDCVDVDDDGSCASEDCDDSDPDRSPLRTEICDAGNVDEDCDDTTFGTRDDDGDGEVDASCCNESAGELVCGTDCDDDDPRRFFRAPEVCDGVDNDCDVMVDEGVSGALYPDLDGDGFGDGDEAPVLACSPGPGWSGTTGDCDDTDPLTKPGGFELCGDGVDGNCDDTVDEGCSCTGDEVQAGGCRLPGRCGTADAVCVDDIFECAASPGPVDETCNEVDDDCDGLVDEGVSLLCFRDMDDDGWPGGAGFAYLCAVDGRDAVGGCPEGYTDRNPEDGRDCVPVDPDVNPGAAEVCGNLRDDDCNLRVDDGCED